PGISIGRAEDNDVVLDDSRVSRHHARIERTDGGIRVSDLGSANGTRLNGVELEPKVPQTLRPGDSVGIGDFSVSLGEGDWDEPPGLGQPRPTAQADDRRLDAGRPRTEPGKEAGPRLIVVTPSGTREFALLDEAVTLGRSSDCDI